MDIPLYHLKSNRLDLTALTEADMTSFAPFFESEEALKYIHWNVGDPGLLEDYFKRQFERYENRQGGMLGLRDRLTGAFVGVAGLLGQEAQGQEVVEIGYSLLPAFWGQGYATEAAKALKDQAFEVGLTDFLVSLVHRNNLPSRGVAERNGMWIWAEQDWKGFPVLVYRIDLQEWNNSKSV
jgi:ribosomal-protein-alanine N-acetyltransferase